MKPFLLILPFFPLISASCPPDYTLYDSNKKCYKFYSTPATYFVSQYRCTEDGAQIASIANQFDNQYVASLLTDGSGWIGLTDQLNNFFQWQWLDNSPSFFFNWATGQPSQGKQCASIRKNDTLWDAQDCNSQLPFVCGYNPATSTQPTVASLTCPTQPPLVCPTQTPVVCPPPTPKTCPLRCDEGWTYYSKTNNCYRTYFDRTWANAEQLCVSYGGHLVSIHSLEENNFVINLSKRGQSKDSGDGQVWIGASRTCSRCDVTWSDGTPFDWNNWGPQEPYYTSDLCCELCADEEMGGRGEWEYLWAMQSCTMTMRAFVCKKIAYSCH